MTIKEVYTFYNSLKEKYNLDYDLIVTHMYGYFGQCWYAKKQIRISLFHIETNSSELIKQTILHEVAHAICGYTAGHNKLWKETLIKIGGKPERMGKGKMPVAAERKQRNDFKLKIGDNT